MAVIPLTAERKGNWLHFSWETVTEADTCEPIYLNHNVSDMFIEISGTMGGATISLDGGVTSGVATASIVDPGGTAIALTAAGGSAIRDAWPFLAPVTASGSSSDIDIEIRMKVVK